MIWQDIIGWAGFAAFTIGMVGIALLLACHLNAPARRAAARERHRGGDRAA